MARSTMKLPEGSDLGVALILKVPRMVAKLARDMNISRAAVYAWKVVPAERVVDVERYSGIPRELLRPDLYRGMRP